MRAKMMYRERYPSPRKNEKDILKYSIWQCRKLCKRWYGGDVFYEWLNLHYTSDEIWNFTYRAKRKVLKDYQKQVKEWVVEDWGKS